MGVDSQFVRRRPGTSCSFAAAAAWRQWPKSVSGVGKAPLLRHAWFVWAFRRSRYSGASLNADSPSSREHCFGTVFE